MSEPDDRGNFFLKITLSVVAGMLVLTAWGNAIAMFVIAIIALVGILLYQRSKRGLWPAVIGLLIASAIVVITKLL